MSKTAGFTLIELMIVVAIIAILAAIATPAYQDYVARAQATDGFSLATAGRVAIADFHSYKGQYPNGNLEASLPAPQSIRSRLVDSVTIGPGDGSITVAFSTSASARIASQQLTMTATITEGSLRWKCGGLPERFVPSSCR